MPPKLCDDAKCERAFTAAKNFPRRFAARKNFVHGNAFTNTDGKISFDFATDCNSTFAAHVADVIVELFELPQAQKRLRYPHDDGGGYEVSQHDGQLLRTREQVKTGSSTWH